MKTFLLTVALMLTVVSNVWALESDGVIYASEVKPVVVVQRQIVQAQADGDSLRVSALQDELACLRGRINKLAHRTVSVAEIEAVAKKMGYYGPPDKWAQPSVDRAVSSGRMVGREPGRNASENAWKQPAQRQEVAVVANRVADTAHNELDTHEKADNAAHQGILARLAQLERDFRILFWIIVIAACLLFLWALIAFFRWLLRGARGGNGLLPNVPVAGVGAAPAANVGNAGGPWPRNRVTW